MIEGLIALTLVTLLVFGPILWRVVHDRREERALAVNAEIRRVLTRALGGESLVSIRVVPATAWRTGRIILSAPADWGWLLEHVWGTLLERTPKNYELVVQPRETNRSWPRSVPMPRRAAA